MNIGVRAHDVSADNIFDISKKVSDLGFSHVQLALRKSIKVISLTDGCFSPGLSRHFKKGIACKRDCVLKTFAYYFSVFSKGQIV